MANQVLKGVAAVLDVTPIGIGDIGMVLDGMGVPTGQIRLGVGSQLGGFTVSGAVGAGAVTAVNGQTGVVSLGLSDLTDVTGTPNVNDILRWNGSAWASTAFAGTLAGLTDVLLTSLSDGQSVRWHAGSSKWVNYTPSTGSGGSDNLGNHTATQDLSLGGFAVNSVASLNLLNTWEVTDSAGGTFILSKASSPALTLLHTTTPGAGYLALPSYGASRPDDSATVSLTNLAYFATNGILRKANRSANANAFKGIPADAFGYLSGLDAGTVGQALIFNGTNYVPTTIAGGGVSTFLGLTDTPANYTGHTLKSLRVNAGETAVEFFTPTAPTFLALTDTPVNFAGAGGRTVKVNSGATALEFVVPTLLGASDVQAGTPADGQGLVWDTGLASFRFTDCLITDFTTLAAGALMYFDGTSWINIPAGVNGQFLKMVGGVPAWAN